MTRRRCQLTVAIAAACAVVCQVLFALEPWTANVGRPAYQPIRMDGGAVPDSQSPRYVAVLGAVRSPRVFELPSRAVTVRELIEAAGGADGDYSGTLSLIRQGRRINSFFDPSRSTGADGIGTLLDGDLLVLRPLAGVRTVEYSTTTGPGRASHAVASSTVFVACVGVAPHPVVLPLRAEHATREYLLHRVFKLTAEEASRAVSVLPASGLAPDDGTLGDGSVLLFNSGLLNFGPGAAERYHFPPPVPLVSGGETALAVMATTEDISQPPPLETVPAVEPPPVEPLVEQTHEPPPLPLLPGAPFDVYEQRDSEVSPPIEPARVEFGEATVRPMYEVTASSVPPFSRPDPAPVMVDPLLPGPTSPEPHLSPRETRGPDGSEANPDLAAPPTRVAAAGPGLLPPPEQGTPTVGPRRSSPNRVADLPKREVVDLPEQSGTNPLLIVLVTSVVAVLCVVVSWVWLKIERRRAGEGAQSAAAPRAASLLTSPESRRAHPLDDLLANRTPLIEERVFAREQGRLHGPCGGPRRVMIDPPHASAFAPHIHKTTRRREKIEDRYVEHLTAARRRRPERRPEAENSPETAVPREDNSGSSRPAASAMSPSTSGIAGISEEDLLAKVLAALEENRK